MSEANEEISAIIVTYFPDIIKVNRLVNSLLGQVGSIIVVDNGSPSSLQSALGEEKCSGVEFIYLSENFGVAAAQNVGIRRAQELGSVAVVLFDQDSLPATDMVSKLYNALQSLIIQDCAVAAVGPCYFDHRFGGASPFIAVKGLSLLRGYCAGQGECIQADYLISSGSLIPMSVLDKVGLMMEGLFIDYIDIEWGLRAKSMGLRCYGVCEASMQHELGEEPVYFLGRFIPTHKPFRHYYHFRNAIWMYRQPLYPANWKFVDARRLFLKYIFYSFCGKSGGRHLVMMSKGIFDGFLGRLGPLK